MSTRRVISTTSSSAVYIIALVVIIVAFLLLGGGTWLKETFNGSATINMANWNWMQIIISLAIGFVLGLLSGRRRW